MAISATARRGSLRNAGGHFEQTAAAGELHAEEGQPVVALAYLIDGENVGMIEVRRGLSFAAKAH